MGWEELDSRFLRLSQDSIDSIEEADAIGLSEGSDGGASVMSAENGSGPSEGSADMGDLWWVDELKRCTAHMKYASFQRLTLLSACSGMLAEGFALKAERQRERQRVSAGAGMETH